MSKSLFQIGEFGLIDLLKKQIGPTRAMRGIGDDAAVLPYTKDKYQLLTTDMLLEGVHFTRKMDPKWIGHKAMACNVSDIAAMGGLPKFAVVSLGVPGNLSLKVIKAVYQGMNQCAKKFGVNIVGGDTNKSDKMIINVALAGEAKKNELVTRSGAKAGDQIFVTGPLGKSFQSQWHLKFTPRIRESQFLVKNFKPTSMIDISDGLEADLGHILESSHAGAVLHDHKIPLRKGATLKNALGDGEDFELVFTIDPHKADRLIRNKKYKFYYIGEITTFTRPARRRGFTHF